MWVDRSSGRVVCAPDQGQGPPARVNVDVLDNALSGAARLVVPDRGTLARLIRATAKVAATDGSPQRQAAESVLRQLRLASGLRHSSWVPVLTDALARAYHLPQGLDAHSVDDWAFAFALDARDQQATFSGLYVAAREGGHRRSGGAHQAVTAETRALSSARYPGMKSAIAAYHRVTEVATYLSAWDMLDRGLLGLHTLTGDVSELSGPQIGHRGFTALVSQPTRLKANRDVLVMDSVSSEHRATVRELYVQGGDLYAELLWATRRDEREGALLVGHEANMGRRVFVTEAPFMGGRGVGSTSKSHRWATGSNVDRVRHGWQMPAEVAVAGG